MASKASVWSLDPLQLRGEAVQGRQSDAPIDLGNQVPSKSIRLGTESSGGVSLGLLTLTLKAF